MKKQEQNPAECETKNFGRQASSTLFELCKRCTATTYTYTYDGSYNITKIVHSDVKGSPIGMQYRTSSYAEGVWDGAVRKSKVKGLISLIGLKNYTEGLLAGK